MFARFQEHHIKVTVVTCFAPTNDTEEVVKERFYDTLNPLVLNDPIRERLILIFFP
jgi:hypothetical protein